MSEVEKSFGKRRNGLVEGEEAIPVILVLLATGFNLCGQAIRQVIGELVKAVENGDNSALLFNRDEHPRC